MSTSKVTSKGQATIPADVRARLGIKPGDSVEFTVNDAGEMVVRRAPRLSDLTGMIKVDPEYAHISVDEAIELTRQEIGMYGRNGGNDDRD